MNIAGCVPRFLKAHGSLILTILSGVGLVATVVETAKVAPEAQKDLQEELHWQTHFRVDELMEEAEANGHDPDNWTDDEHAELYNQAEQETKLTIWDKINVAGPHYIPVILLGLGTIGCMTGAHILDMKKQAAMAASYAMLQQSFSGYRAEIREKYGAEADKEAYISSQNKIKALRGEIKRLEQEKGVYSFAIATAPGLIFRAKMAQVEQAFAHFNRNVCLRGYGTIKELHEFLGLPTNCPLIACPTAPDEEYGWNEYINEVNYGIGWVDYRIQEVVSKDGEIIYVIYFDIPPYRQEIDDDSEYDLQDYDSYNLERAIEAAKDGYEDAAIRVDVDPDHIVYAQSCF